MTANANANEPIPFADDTAAKAPALPGEVVVRAQHDDAIDACGDDLLTQAIACVHEFGDFHMALSGGSTPMPLYRRLVLDPAMRLFPWKQTHLWIVDERCVPYADPKSNWGHISDLLVEHSGIPKSQAHPMPVVDSVGAATLEAAVAGAGAYDADLRAALGTRAEGHRRLDYVMLGMGPDGHTASLFPHSTAQLERESWVTTNDGSTVVPPRRVTMTYPLLNAARMLCILALGEEKAPTLRKVSAAWQASASRPAAPNGAGASEPVWRELPILGITPVAGHLRWYLDEAACGGLAESP
ncbi:MAG: 6-phosphogluconolactonase [Planctomycetota bacterium]|nr:6-phosphogluconolactonase [Planctomycetota bacterium]MDA1105860.1 6-phosphogluconolactonase [Planctomycetota bacterium]